MFTYILIRSITFPLSFFPYSWIKFLGKWLGLLSYYLITPYRKRALSNLKLAKTLSLSDEEILKCAKESFQTLMTLCLEFPKLAKEKVMKNIAICENKELADQIISQGKGIIFFLGHQSSWEVVLLETTSRIKGVAIGKPIRNLPLYRWIVSVREKFGTRILLPKNAIKEGMRALKSGLSLGIVGDQAMPESGHAFPFFGMKAWTSPAPALLSYKTNSPIIVITTRRKKNHYHLRYSDPLWPDQNASLASETERLMTSTLSILEKSIREKPGEYLWQHNRWKQDPHSTLKKRFKKDCLAIILPEKKEEYEFLKPHLSTFRSLYPKSFISLFSPFTEPLIPDAEHIPFSHEQDLLVHDYRFKLVFNFSSFKKVRNHFLRQSAFEVLTFKDIQKEGDFSERLIRLLCRPRQNIPR